MGSSNEFGPDTESIRAWLDKRATYARDARVVGAPLGSLPPRDSLPAGESLPPRDSLPARDLSQAGRSVVEALRGDPPGGPPPRAAAPAPAPVEPLPAAAPAPVEPVRPAPPPRVRAAPEVRHGRWTEPVDNLDALEASTDAQFPVRRGVRRTLSWILLAILVGAGLASYAAWQEPSDTNLGIAATLGLLLLVVWAVRAGCAT
ncbi:hypothetical protein, partial [Nocardioides albidus]|uniref:hypothetical protein n=1 Tax=Nocardioides albidus TaxID=1517589 RepID=UPI001960D618